FEISKGGESVILGGKSDLGFTLFSFKDNGGADFCEYAELCFWQFGDWVKYLITMNEPYTYIVGVYVFGNAPPCRGPSSTEHITGTFPEGRCIHNKTQQSCNGDLGREPYLVTHYKLLAHVAAIQLYRQKFQISQGGKIGITLVSKWMEPLDESNDRDVKASYMEPVTRGDYPESMKEFVGSRLPKFTKEQSNMLKGSINFLGLNYYTANYVSDGLEVNNGLLRYNTNPQVTYSSKKNYNALSIPVCILLCKSILMFQPKCDIYFVLQPSGTVYLLGHQALQIGSTFIRKVFISYWDT
ncbi:hypothetical protein RJ640_027157, partial [Escallonia rubra]